MLYVIRRTDRGGGWVTLPGSPGSYTHKLQDAKVWHSREEAERERCIDNEVAESLEEVLHNSIPR
jgi:hypothetical protein